MTIIEFLRKHRHTTSVYSLELFARVPRNTIAHAIGNEKRPIKPAYESAIYTYLEEMEEDLSNALVEYWQRTEKERKLKGLPSPHGANTDQRRQHKRKVS